MNSLCRRTALMLLASAALPGRAQTPPPTTVRVRGVLLKIEDTRITVKDKSGEVVEILLSPKLVVTEVYPIARSEIRPGSFIGTAATPQADGSRRAVAVMVFPETARGAGEGDYPFDLMPQSTMTNATVAGVVAVGSGQEMQLKHKNGEARIVVPDNAPVVSFKPADRSLLVPGASVTVSVQMVDEKPTAMRVNAGRDGFVLPY